MPDYVERAPSDYVDIQALIDEGKLAEAEGLASSKTGLSGEDKHIVTDLLEQAKLDAAEAKKAAKAESKAEATKK